MRLRIQHKAKKHALEIEDTATIFQLLGLVRSSINEESFVIKSGFPPKPLNIDDPQQTLAAANIRSGENFIIESSSGASEQAVSQSSFRISDPLHSSKIAQAPSVSQPRKKEILQDTFSFGNLNGSAAKVSTSDATLPPEINVPNKGIMTLRVQPDDNSCLFRAIGYLCMRSVDAMEELRQLIATTIQENPDEYPDAVLGMKRDVYCAKMNRADTWGGEIEMKILSDHFQVQIASIDCKSGHIYRYGENFEDCVYIVYSGIHYDALAVMPTANAPPEWDQTQFPSSDSIITKAAQDLVTILRGRNYFTDTTSFDLRCNDCGTGLKGESGAQKHALQTGHVNFGEYRSD